MLRRLAINDERFIASILAPGAGTGSLVDSSVEPARAEGRAERECSRRLVSFAAVVGADASPTSIEAAVSSALAAGVTPEEIVEALLRIAPAIGTVRAVAIAPHVAAAIGYDLWADLELLESERPGDRPPADRQR